MLCLKIELYLSPSTAGSTDSCSCACHDGPDQSLPDSGLVWYKPLSIFFLMHACGEVITIAHFSVTKAQTFDSTQWHLVEDITHLSMLIFFSQRALPSPLPLLCYSFLLLLVSAHDKKECLHWTNSSSHDTSSLIPSDSCQFKTQEKPSVWGWGTWIALVIITLKRQGFAVAVPSSDFSWLCPEDHPHHSK